MKEDRRGREPNAQQQTPPNTTTARCGVKYQVAGGETASDPLIFLALTATILCYSIIAARCCQANNKHIPLYAAQWSAESPTLSTAAISQLWWDRKTTSSTKPYWAAMTSAVQPWGEMKQDKGKGRRTATVGDKSQKGKVRSPLVSCLLGWNFPLWLHLTLSVYSAVYYRRRYPSCYCMLAEFADEQNEPPSPTL